MTDISKDLRDLSQSYRGLNNNLATILDYAARAIDSANAPTRFNDSNVDMLLWLESEASRMNNIVARDFIRSYLVNNLPDDDSRLAAFVAGKPLQPTPAAPLPGWKNVQVPDMAMPEQTNKLRQSEAIKW